MTTSSPLASKAADVFVKAWVSGERLGPDTLPSAPATVDEMYETHLAIQQHPLVASSLGGHGGYKLGAIGAEGQPCLYAPLFADFIVEPNKLDNGRPQWSNLAEPVVSSSRIALWQIEPEFALVMGADLPARPDGEPHTADSAWAAVSEVILCIELCGKRGTPEAYAASTKLGSYADTLSSGGVVLGPRLATSATDARQAILGATALFVNDELIAEGSGAAAPEGGPAQALAWLANHLNGRGLSLQRGQLIATGQTCNTKAIKAGDRVRATFGELGMLEMVIAP